MEILWEKKSLKYDLSYIILLYFIKLLKLIISVIKKIFLHINLLI